jgi:hypothetical protein
MAPLQHGFKDPKWSGPKAGFEKAKKQLESAEWEDVVDGVVAIVAVVKKAPEVRNLRGRCYEYVHITIKNVLLFFRTFQF